jgi:hypothetical protein
MNVTIITPILDMTLLTVGAMMGADSIAGTYRKLTILAITITPRGHHIVTTTIAATKGILMGPGMSPLVAEL